MMSSTHCRLLHAVLLLTSTASAASIPTSSLFARQATCSLDANSPCKQAGLPSSFCCPSGTSCSLLAGNTTILCCPSGSNCNKITAITCDVMQQDPALHPEAPIKTTALKATLPQCGENCCPFGFSCTADSKCIRDADQSIAPSAPTAPVASETATPSPSATPPVASDSGSGNGNGTMTMSIVGGVVGGVFALIAIAVAVWVILGKKKKRDSDSDLKLTRSTSSFGNIITTPQGNNLKISSPKLQNEDSALRSDFLGKSSPQSNEQPPSPAYSLKDRMSTVGGSGFGLGISKGRPSSEYGNINRPLSTWSRDSTITNGVSVPPIRKLRSSPRGRPQTPDTAVMPPMPETPRGQMRSMEITIGADPDTVGRRRGSDADTVITNATTWKRMIKEADVPDVTKGERYVPKGAYGTPESRR